MADQKAHWTTIIFLTSLACFPLQNASKVERARYFPLYENLVSLKRFTVATYLSTVTSLVSFDVKDNMEPYFMSTVFRDFWMDQEGVLSVSPSRSRKTFHRTKGLTKEDKHPLSPSAKPCTSSVPHHQTLGPI